MSEDKVSRFKSIPGGFSQSFTGLRPRGSTGPQTVPGQLAERTGQGLSQQLEELRREREAGELIVKLDPKTIGHSRFANRLTVALDAADKDFEAFKRNIAEKGLDHPIVVRPAPDGAPTTYEIVSGHRRHAACLQLDAERAEGFPVLARIDRAAVDDHILVQKMYRENADRLDLSPFEKGQMFRAWLDEGLYADQNVLAEAIGVSPPVVTRYLQISDLPPEILAAFGDGRVIAMRWMQDLATALNKNEPRVLASARALANEEAPRDPRSVLSRLLAAARPRSAVLSEEALKVKGKVGAKVVRRGARLTIKFGNEVGEDGRGRIDKELRAWLRERLERELTGGPP